MSQTNPTLDDVWRLFQETDRLMKESAQETNRKFQETDRKFQETDRKFQETDQKLVVLQICAYGVAVNARSIDSVTASH